MIARLSLSAAQRIQLAAEARVAFPRECCGLIEGVREAGGVVALMLHSTANLSEALDGFEIDPAAHLRLSRETRAAGREIVGCYHSHPRGRPLPSERDRATANAEGFVWLIAALADETAAPAFAAFAGVEFRPLALADA